MTVHLGPLVVEAREPASVERFWRAALGDAGFDRYLDVQPEQQPKLGKNRVHVDLYVRDLASLIELGATVLDDYPPTRATMADVEGNEFCAFVVPDRAPAPLAQVFAVCTDSARPAELAAWWAPRVGAEVGPGPDGVPRYLSGCSGWADVAWKFNGVDDERVAPNRWRWSVTDWPSAPLVDPDGNAFSLRATPTG